MIRRRWAGLTAVLVALAVTVVMAADVKVTPLVTPDGHVFASFAGPSLFTSETRDLVKSGVPLTLTFVVELKRPSAIWMDRSIGAVTLAASVKFDNLTGKYQVSKQVDDHVISSEVTDQEDQMRTWITTFDRMEIQAREPLESNAEYYVQVRVHASPKQKFSIWPWTWGRDDGAGRADFTFIR